MAPNVNRTMRSKVLGSDAYSPVLAALPNTGRLNSSGNLI